MSSSQIFFYVFSTSVTPPPASSRLLLNNGIPYSTVTKIWLHYITDGGADARFVLLQSLPLGATIYLQDKNDSSTAHKFTLVADVVDLHPAPYMELAVRWEFSTGGPLNNNQAVAVIAVTPAPVTPAPPVADSPVLAFARVTILAPLVSLVTAKDHLKVTDSAHDADINQKLQAAQEQILAKLAYAADPAWTEATVPRGVHNAILLLLEAFYEHESNRQGELLKKALEAIDLLLGLYRDPTLA